MWTRKRREKQKAHTAEASKYIVAGNHSKKAASLFPRRLSFRVVTDEAGSSNGKTTSSTEYRLGSVAWRDLSVCVNRIDIGKLRFNSNFSL